MGFDSMLMRRTSHVPRAKAGPSMPRSLLVLLLATATDGLEIATHSRCRQRGWRRPSPIASGARRSV
jgi:hypothetical protein